MYATAKPRLHYVMDDLAQTCAGPPNMAVHFSSYDWLAKMGPAFSRQSSYTDHGMHGKPIEIVGWRKGSIYLLNGKNQTQLYESLQKLCEENAGGICSWW